MEESARDVDLPHTIQPLQSLERLPPTLLFQPDSPA